MRNLALLAVLALAACNQAQAPAQNEAAAPAAQRPAPAATLAPAQSERGVVPAAFQGEWNADLADCGSGMNDSRLEIGPDTIRFYESSGRIKSVSVWDSGDVTVLADVTGEGETRETTHTFRLSDDGLTLTDLNGGLVRQRCPKA
jgi:hypothetical protein